VIEGGLQALDKALQINPDYDDAMAYENLLVRERADLADTKEEYEKQLKIADDWIQKALVTKKRKADAKNKTGGSIVVDPNAK
jgi:Tfp pilus assembly protein PilF